MLKFTHLQEKDRREIDILFNNSRFSRKKIAKELGFSISTISDEIKRGRTRCAKIARLYCLKHNLRLIDGKYFYRWNEAQYKADIRHKRSQKVNKIENNTILRNKIIYYLTEKSYKPDVIAAVLHNKYGDKNMYACKETIYKWIYSPTGLQYIKFLDKGNKKAKKKRGITRRKKSIMIRRKSIHDRDEIVEKRARIGDFEADTVVAPINGESKKCLITVCDRKSRKLFIRVINNKRQDEALTALTDVLMKISSKARHTMTFDNGTEFYSHYKLADKFNIKTYFADTYSSWQRGTNERHNGLIRRFLPKKTDFSKVDIKEIEQAADFWNNYPRKILGYKTPNQVWTEELKNFTDG
jgi:IS30 family transposase